MTDIGIDGITVSPGYAYERAPDQEHFLNRRRTKELFRDIFRRDRGRRWSFNQSSLFLDFLAGNQSYHCTPWGNPTRNYFGWQRPCYLLGEGYAKTFKELMEETDWDAYGTGNYEKCADCMVHSGYEATAVMDSVKHPLKAAAVALRGHPHRGRDGAGNPARPAAAGRIRVLPARRGRDGAAKYAATSPRRARAGPASADRAIRVSRASPISVAICRGRRSTEARTRARFGVPASDERDQSSRRKFPARGVGDRARDEKGDAGLRGDAGDDLAFEIDGKGACIAPGAALVCLGCEDRARPRTPRPRRRRSPGQSRPTRA